MTTTTIGAGICRDRIYTKEEVTALTGWGRNSLAEARKRGLQVLYLHRTAWVEGGALIDYIKEHAQHEYH